MPSLYQKLHGPMPKEQAARERDRFPRVKAEVQRKLAREMRDNPSAGARPDQAELAERIRSLLAEETELTGADREELGSEILAAIAGLGPIQPLIEDPTVSEIMVNSPDDVFIERQGRLFKANIRFRDDREILDLIDRIVTPLGRRVDEQSPMVDARLPDGSRVNAIIPPLALKGPCLTIRRFPQKALTVDDLIVNGTISEEMADFVRQAVGARLNILISGGTASGKTTLLNCLSTFIPADERIITIEDAAELRLQQDHVVSLETRPANLEGSGEITIRHLVRNALRMRPDRIIVGEVRSAETLDMLQAMNTGHDGSLTTVHANGPREALSRIETMVLMAGVDLPLRAIREQIGSALQIVIQIARAKDGRRRITHIAEIHGLEGDTVILQDLFTFDDAEGVFRASGYRPKAFARFQSAGVVPEGEGRVFHLG